MTLDLRSITVENILSQTTIETAQRIFDQTWCVAPSNGTEPWTGFIPPVGTWRYDEMLDEFAVLVELPADQVEPSEKDWDSIRRHWTFQNYVRWTQAGYQAPPVDVVRNVNGKLLSSNRRRVLVAWEVKAPTVLAWVSETDEDGRALWRMK